MTFNISTINICVIADQSRNSLFASAIKIYVPDPSWQSMGLEIVEALGVSAFRNNIRCGINEAVPWELRSPKRPCKGSEIPLLRNDKH